MVLTHVPGARDLFAQAHPWCGLVELAGSASATRLTDALLGALDDWFDRGVVSAALVAGSPAQRRALWTLREGISEAQNPEGPSLQHDVTVPIRRLPAFVAPTARLLEEAMPGVRLVTYGHVGDGKLHHNLSAPQGMGADVFGSRAAELTTIVYDAVAAAGGSLSAEHGIGTAKRAAAAACLDTLELELMRTVKRAFDPQGLMNPGKLL
jgi:malate dehydrogenase (quinone)